MLLANKIKLIAYLNVGAIEKTRLYYKTYKKYAKYYHRDVISISNPFHYKKFNNLFMSFTKCRFASKYDGLGPDAKKTLYRAIRR